MSVPDPHAASKANGDVAATQSTPTADSSSRVVAPAYLSAAWWQQHWQEIDKRIYECVGIWIGQWWPPERDAITGAVGDVFGEEHHNQREALAKIKDRVLVLETSNSFEERLNKLANEVKHHRTEIPLKLVAALDASGIELISDNAASSGGGRGIRLKRPPACGVATLTRRAHSRSGLSSTCHKQQYAQ